MSFRIVECAGKVNKKSRNLQGFRDFSFTSFTSFTTQLLKNIRLCRVAL